MEPVNDSRKKMLLYGTEKHQETPLLRFDTDSGTGCAPNEFREQTVNFLKIQEVDRDRLKQV